MRQPEDRGFPVLPPGRPTRDLLLAQALDACITAERRLPGSSQEIIARQPAWARADLRRLIGLAGSLDAAASNAVMSSEFRVSARARLMHRIGGAAGVQAPPASLAVARLTAVAANPPGKGVVRLRKTFWVWRATAGLIAAGLAIAATLTASASALPGEPLYSLKQAQEELGVRLAGDDQERALALLRQADARLGETARLLQLGRTADAAATTLRYDQVVQRATMSYVGTIDDTPQVAPATVHMEASLSQDQEQLQAMLQSAPEPARADLREALVTTERGRALVADPRPVERALGRRDASQSALGRGDASQSALAAIPTMAAEDSPTVVPTAVPESPTALPTPRPALVPPTATPVVVVADTPDEDVAAPLVAHVAGVDATTSGGGSRHAAPPARLNTVEDRGNAANNPPADEGAPGARPVVGHEDHPDTNAGVSVAAPGGGDDHAQGADRTDVAAPHGGDDHAQGPNTADVATSTNGRAVSSGQGGGSDARSTADAQDNRAHAADVPSASIVARPPEPPAGGGKSGVGGDGDGGTGAARAGAGPAPERVTGGSTTTTARAAHDSGVDAHVAPTSQSLGTKPQATPTPTPRHASDGDANQADSAQKSNGSPAPGSPAHSTGDTHPDGAAATDRVSAEGQAADVGRR